MKLATKDPASPIENDVVLVWVDQPRILTGKDILERLLTGIGDAESIR
jgi:hypothetical protein